MCSRVCFQCLFCFNPLISHFPGTAVKHAWQSGKKGKCIMTSLQLGIGFTHFISNKIRRKCRIARWMHDCKDTTPKIATLHGMRVLAFATNNLLLGVTYPRIAGRRWPHNVAARENHAYGSSFSFLTKCTVTKDESFRDERSFNDGASSFKKRKIRIRSN